MYNLNLKRILKVLCVGLILLLLLPVAALATGGSGGWQKVMFTGDSAKSGETVILEASRTAKGPGFYSGNIVRIDGNVDGTTFAAGQEITVSGDIRGDLFVAGQMITVNGNVYGNLYAAGQRIMIKGRVNGDTFVAGEKAETAKEAVLGRDMMVFAANIIQAGRVERQLFSDSRNIVLSGSVGDDARLNVDTLEVQDGAEVKGKLVYSSPKEAAISDKAKIAGGAEWKKAAPRPEKRRPTTADQVLGFILSIAGALLVWFIGNTLKPDLWTGLAGSISGEPGKTMGIGALALIMTPVLVIILMATVIGLPVGILLLMAYGITLYLAKIIVGVTVGGWLASRFNWPVLHKGVWLVLLGLAILAVVTRLPFVGFIFTLVTLFWGLGAVVLAFVRPHPGTN